ncbi:SPRY domain-containing protein [Lysinibacillus parviboronicapiens]|uniref:SPRY domain-containing protein n=1 Tax=Lysinibacillus parviboronicapiens TaxID=436516 RepID=UPI000D3C8D1D|nr:SPRY domain-containing protein [Lysinibacillus parviboronicapiens]
MSEITWDFNNKGSGVVLSNGNLTALVPNVNNTVRATKGQVSGKWYWEVTVNSMSTTPAMTIGIVNKSASLTANIFTSQNARFYYTDGRKMPESVAYGASYTVGDIIGIALNLDDGTLEFYKNGVSQGISHTDIKTMGEIFPAVSNGGSAYPTTYTANFGATPFKHGIPNGYKPLDSIKKTLLQSNSKTFSLESIDTWYETNMTSNTAPSPLVASASSVHSSGTFPAWKAFNGTDVGTLDTWISANGALKGWIQIDYGKKLVVNRLVLTSSNYVNYAASSPKDFDILYSNDGINFEKALSLKGETNWSTSETREFHFKEVEARYFRIDVAEANNTVYIVIGEILFGYFKDTLVQISKISQKNFSEYGVSPPLENLSSIFKSKDYILQDEVSENSDELWTTQLDRKPLSISFE